MASRPCIPPYLVVNAQQMSNNVTSDATNTQQLYAFSYQMEWTGAPTGTFTLQGSLDHSVYPNGAVQNAGTWNTLPATVTGSAGGSAGSGIYDGIATGIPWIRVIYTSTATGTETIAPVADVAGSLAGKSFLISDEASAHLYQIWFKVSGVGSAPTAVSGYTLIEQDITTGDTAATIGAALATTIAALNSTNSFTTAGTTTVTVTMKTAGPFVIASDVNTGFTFAGATGAGILNVYMASKVS